MSHTLKEQSVQAYPHICMSIYIYIHTHTKKNLVYSDQQIGCCMKIHGCQEFSNPLEQGCSSTHTHTFEKTHRGSLEMHIAQGHRQRLELTGFKEHGRASLEKTPWTGQH